MALTRWIVYLARMKLEDLDALDTRDKLAAMERLWSGLRKDIESSKPPAWHRAVLEERRRLIESGQADYIPWGRIPKI